MTSSRMPASLIAGDSLRLAIPAGDYSQANGWAVSLVLQALAGGTPVTVAGTASGNDWAVLLSATTSAAMAAGAWRYAIVATKTAERATLDSGELRVLPDPAAPNADQRSPARRALDAIDAVIESRASSEDMKFTFADGRALEKVPHAELLSLRQHYARIVARETSKGRGPKRVLMRL